MTKTDKRERPVTRAELWVALAILAFLTLLMLMPFRTTAPITPIDTTPDNVTVPEEPAEPTESTFVASALAPVNHTLEERREELKTELIAEYGEDDPRLTIEALDEELTDPVNEQTAVNDPTWGEYPDDAKVVSAASVDGLALSYSPSKNTWYYLGAYGPVRIPDRLVDKYKNTDPSDIPSPY